MKTMPRRRRTAAAAAQVLLGFAITLAPAPARAQLPALGECVPKTLESSHPLCEAQRCAIAGTPDVGHPEVDLYLRYGLPADWAGERLPVFLYYHGWGEEAQDPCGGVVNESTIQTPWLGNLVVDGSYAVVTFDARGHNCYADCRAPLPDNDVLGGNPCERCGYTYISDPDYAYPDTSAVIDWVADQPWALLDGAGDPRVAVFGRSLGGMVAAGISTFDPRVDVVLPAIVNCDLLNAWHENGLDRFFGSKFLPEGALTFTKLSPELSDAFVQWVATGDIDAAKNEAGEGVIRTLLWQVSTCRFLTGGTFDRRFDFLGGTSEPMVDRPAMQIVHMNDTPVGLPHQARLLDAMAPSAPFKLFTTNEDHDYVVPQGLEWGNDECGSDPADEEPLCLHPCGSNDPVGGGQLTKRGSAIKRWLDRYLKGDVTVDTGPQYEIAMDDATCAYPESLDAISYFANPAPYTLTSAGPVSIPIVSYQDLDDRGYERRLVGLSEVSFDVDDIGEDCDTELGVNCWSAVASIYIVNDDPASGRSRYVHSSMVGFAIGNIADEAGVVEHLPMDGMGTELVDGETLYLRVQEGRQPYYDGTVTLPVTISNVVVGLPTRPTGTCASLGLPGLLSDSFEQGLEDPAWSRVQDPLDHLSGAGAGLAGSPYGLEVTIAEDGAGTSDREHYVLDTTPEGVARYCAEFKLDPNGSQIGGRVKIFATRGDDGVRLMRLILREKPTGSGYQVRYSSMNDNHKWVNLPWVDLADTESWVALSWEQGDGNQNGSFRLYVDGTEGASREAFNNDDRSLGAQAIGNLGLFKAPTQATLRWDQFRSFGAAP